MSATIKKFYSFIYFKWRRTCYIGGEYYGNISYADDLKLLCPSINGLQKMLDICDVFLKEYFVKYNASKTVAIW